MHSKHFYLLFVAFAAVHACHGLFPHWADLCVAFGEPWLRGAAAALDAWRVSAGDVTLSVLYAMHAWIVRDRGGRPPRQRRRRHPAGSRRAAEQIAFQAEPA